MKGYLFSLTAAALLSALLLALVPEGSGRRTVRLGCGMLLAVVALLLLKKVVRHWTGVTACTLILSGGIGNIIDRIVHGYVVDMFDLQLFSYPVFNLADCCVVVGAILGGVYYLFLYDKYDKKKKESDHAHDPSDPS